MDGPLLGMLGYAYNQNHEFDNAAAAFEKGLARDPENQDIRRAYAETLMGNGKMDAARTELQKILKADPEDGQSYLHLARLDRQQGRFDAGPPGARPGQDFDAG